MLFNLPLLRLSVGRNLKSLHKQVNSLDNLKRCTTSKVEIIHNNWTIIWAFRYCAIHKS